VAGIQHSNDGSLDSRPSPGRPVADMPWWAGDARALLGPLLSYFADRAPGGLMHDSMSLGPAGRPLAVQQVDRRINSGPWSRHPASAIVSAAPAAHPVLLGYCVHAAAIAPWLLAASPASAIAAAIGRWARRHQLRTKPRPERSGVQRSSSQHDSRTKGGALCG